MSVGPPFAPLPSTTARYIVISRAPAAGAVQVNDHEVSPTVVELDARIAAPRW